MCHNQRNKFWSKLDSMYTIAYVLRNPDICVVFYMNVFLYVFSCVSQCVLTLFFDIHYLFLTSYELFNEY